MKLFDCKAGDVVRVPLDKDYKFTMDSDGSDWKAGRFIEVTVLLDGGSEIGWKKDNRKIGHRGGRAEAICGQYKKIYPHLTKEIYINNSVPCYSLPPKNKAEIPIFSIAIAAILIGLAHSSKNMDVKNATS